MSTHLPGFRSFFRIFASFCIDQSSHQQHKVNPSHLQCTHFMTSWDIVQYLVDPYLKVLYYYSEFCQEKMLCFFARALCIDYLLSLMLPKSSVGI